MLYAYFLQHILQEQLILITFVKPMPGPVRLFNKAKVYLLICYMLPVCIRGRLMIYYSSAHLFCSFH